MKLLSAFKINIGLVGFIHKIKMRVRREQFITTPLAMLTSPVYIIRSGLYKTIVHLAPLIKGSVLDIGCGQKPYESIFLNAKSYIGVDIEVSGHNHDDSKVDFYYDGKTLPFSDNSFDSLVCFEVLEHVFNVDELLAELNRVIKPNGFFLLTVPFVWEEHETPYDFSRYTSYGMVNIMTKNKFEVVELIKSTNNVSTIGQLFINYLAQHALHNGAVMALFFQVIIIFPLNLVVLFLSCILPKRYSLFCNTILLCKSVKA